MKRYIAAFAIMGALIAPAYAADSYTIDPGFSVPVFEVPKLGFMALHGHFNKTSGKVMIDLAARTGSVDFTIYTESLDTGWNAWTNHLSDEGLFNVKKFPTMTFKSNKLIFNGNKVVGAEGQFTMIGVTKPLNVNVVGFQCGNHPINNRPMCAGNISATIKRSDFGLTQYIPSVSDEVNVSVPIEAYKD